MEGREAEKKEVALEPFTYLLRGQGLPTGSLITGRNDASRFNKGSLYSNFSDDRENRWITVIDTV